MGGGAGCKGEGEKTGGNQGGGGGGWKGERGGGVGVERVGEE